MRFTLVGMMVVGALVAAAVSAWAQPGQPVGQLPQQQTPQGAVAGGYVASSSPTSVPSGQVGTEESGIIAISAPVGDKVQRITVIDARNHVMAVYHVDENGVIELKNVRKIHYDLQMVQFNGTSPLPQEIRAKIEQLR